MIGIGVPIIVFVIGEGGSGGALGIGVGDRVCVLQNSYYSVISPEGCAAILWKDRARSDEAAKALKLTAQDLLNFGIIDNIVPEPVGGAHRNPQLTAENIKRIILGSIKDMSSVSKDDMLKARYEKFRRIGKFIDPDIPR
jgi:acetyl-CoA carboxylase carboxyl transferase subunit alpha